MKQANKTQSEVWEVLFFCVPSILQSCQSLRLANSLSCHLFHLGPPSHFQFQSSLFHVIYDNKLSFGLLDFVFCILLRLVSLEICFCLLS